MYNSAHADAGGGLFLEFFFVDSYPALVGCVEVDEAAFGEFTLDYASGVGVFVHSGLGATKTVGVVAEFMGDGVVNDFDRNFRILKHGGNRYLGCSFAGIIFDRP